MQLRTHLKIDKSLSGEVVELSEGYAKLRLKTDSRMVADDMGRGIEEVGTGRGEKGRRKGSRGGIPLRSARKARSILVRIRIHPHLPC